MHAWPLLRIVAGASSGITSSRSASSRMIAADLPPSSSAQRLICSPQIEPIAAPGARAAGEADLVDQRVPDELLAHRAIGRNDVQHTGREPGLLEDLGEHERVERRLLRRLEHDGAAGEQRGAELRHREPQREVPGDDRADDADRLAAHEQAREHAGPVLLPRVRLGLVGVPVEEELRHRDLQADARDRRADLERRQLRELVRAGLDLPRPPGAGPPLARPLSRAATGRRRTRRAPRARRGRRRRIRRAPRGRWALP